MTVELLVSEPVAAIVEMHPIGAICVVVTFPKNKSSKGKSLAFIADYLHISLDDTMAIGDNYNDVSMFEHAYHSVAMGNSNDDIKNLCRYTTLTNLESGVGHAIKTFALNK